MTAEEMRTYINLGWSVGATRHDYGWSQDAILALCDAVLVAGCTFDASDDPKDWCCDKEPKDWCDFCKARARLVELGLLQGDE